MNLNMLLVPALSFGSSDSLFSMILAKGYNPKEFLRDIYYSDTGFFFVALIIQQGWLSAAFYVLRLNDLMVSYFSPALADFKRKYMSDSMPWRRPISFTFQYGYFYAQTMTIFAIILIYSSTVPIITLAGALFLFLKHGVDSFNILTWHRKELESKSEVLNHIIFIGQIILVLYQSAVLVFFSMNDMHIQSFFIAMIMIMTILVIVLTNEHVFEPEKIPSLVMVERANQSLDLVANSISKWRREYSHPLIVISASHQAHVYGSEILIRDNWHDFMNDEEIKQFLQKIDGEDDSHKGGSIADRNSLGTFKRKRQSYDV